MILADTSIWIDHIRSSNVMLEALLNKGQILAHPMIVGELAMGKFRQREKILHYLQLLPQAAPANDTETLIFIERHTLFGIRIGYVDAHLLASTRLSNAQLWTRDKRLHEAATKLKLAANHIN